MLTPFPGLLVFSFFAPTLIRVGAACLFAYLAYSHYTHREEIGKMHFPVVGRGEWIAWLAVIVEAGTALALFLGYYTQYAAIVGALMALKQIVWGRKYPHFFIISRSTSFLLLVITLSLLLTGAGAFAFDLPL